jgi:hypothetical protein
MDFASRSTCRNFDSQGTAVSSGNVKGSVPHIRIFFFLSAAGTEENMRTCATDPTICLFSWIDRLARSLALLVFPHQYE